MRPGAGNPREEPRAPEQAARGGREAASLSRTILCVRGTQASLAADQVVREAHLRMVSGETLLAILACSPVDLEDLAIGFLYSQGLIESMNDLSSLTITADPEAGDGAAYFAHVAFRDPARAARAAVELAAMRFVASGCGAAPWKAPARATADVLSGPGSEPSRQSLEASQVDAATIRELARQLQHCSPLFQATGGVHAAALSGPLPGEPGLLVVREDIGRHNAVDKIAGYCLRQGIGPADKALLVTGRLSVEIVGKAARMGCGYLVSRSAPTSLATDLAEEAGITLVGFARGERLNAYTHWWRLRV